MKNKLGYDDTLDVFGIHGMAGLFGAIGLTFVLRPGTIECSLLHQLWVQIEGCLTSVFYSAIVTLILVVLVDKLFGFRLSADAEKAGIDLSLHSERGYGLLNLNS
jgi:Amt family ammonium transporter